MYFYSLWLHEHMILSNPLLFANMNVVLYVNLRASVSIEAISPYEIPLQDMPGP